VLVVAGRFAPGYNAADQPLVALCEAPHNKRMQQTIPPANKFASGLAPDPQRCFNWKYSHCSMKQIVNNTDGNRKFSK
jgi:hypothetical protein